jgi:2,4-dienoyl-CoA reductase-like NADH-dependent reductase (Old Yellow Enzyme family)
MSSILFESASIKGVQLKNRFVRSATMEGLATFDGRPTQKLKELYFKLAEGEVGLIVTGAALVEAYKNLPNIDGLPFPLAIDEDRHVKDWREGIDGVHERGSKIAMQITHPGRQDYPSLRGSTPIAPSAVPLEDRNIIPREMTVDEIKEMVDKFAQACRRVKEAGFDAVQLHGGHGYLINNFISPYANVRTDRYGGSTENRSRFIVEIVEKARKFVGPGYPLMIKMNFDDFIEGGLDKDEAVRVAKIIAQAGIDCIEVSGGTQAEGGKHISVKGINTEEKEAYFRPYAEALKEHVSVPVILVGGLRTPSVMEKLVEDGVTDLVSMCRPFIREPQLIKRWKDGDLTKAKCISCNKCLENWIKRPTRCYIEEPLEGS